MPWWRGRKVRPQHDELDTERDRQIDDRLAEADAALERAHAQAREGRRITRVLKDIREENHFSERIFGQGMGA